MDLEISIGGVHTAKRGLQSIFQALNIVAFFPLRFFFFLVGYDVDSGDKMSFPCKHTDQERFSVELLRCEGFGFRTELSVPSTPARS